MSLSPASMLRTSSAPAPKVAPPVARPMIATALGVGLTILLAAALMIGGAQDRMAIHQPLQRTFQSLGVELRPGTGGALLSLAAFQALELRELDQHEAEPDRDEEDEQRPRSLDRRTMPRQPQRQQRGQQDRR